METVAAGEMILGVITCSCGIRFGLLEFILLITRPVQQEGKESL